MRNFVLSLVATGALVLSSPANSQGLDLDRVSDETLDYVEANLLAIFYHELGHALIDVLGLPIFGQEEDAADVLSVFLIDAFYEEEDAVWLAQMTGFGFLENADEEVAYWDVHGPDLQRYFNLVCIFYGAEPDMREGVAVEMGLPEERAYTCESEYDQAAGSWGSVMDSIASDSGGESFHMAYVDGDDDATLFTANLMESEVEALNAEFHLPETVNVTVVPCGEVNAFYDSSTKEIIMCTEFADYLAVTSPE